MIKTHLSLVLVDGFLQCLLSKIITTKKKSHNPYFSRWFSAISQDTPLEQVEKESQSLF